MSLSGGENCIDLKPQIRWAFLFFKFSHGKFVIYTNVVIICDYQKEVITTFVNISIGVDKLNYTLLLLR